MTVMLSWLPRVNASVMSLRASNSAFNSAFHFRLGIFAGLNMPVTKALLKMTGKILNDSETWAVTPAIIRQQTPGQVIPL